MHTVDGIHDRHYLDPESGAIIFPPGPEQALQDENRLLKALMGAMLTTLSPEQQAAIPVNLKALVLPEPEATDGDQ